MSLRAINDHEEKHDLGQLSELVGTLYGMTSQRCQAASRAIHGVPFDLTEHRATNAHFLAVLSEADALSARIRARLAVVNLQVKF